MTDTRTSGILLNACLLVILSAGVLGAQDKTFAGCGDFLAELHKKPRNLEFVSCSRHMERQGKPWTAVYRVAGEHAAKVEQFLVREFGIKKMTHACCEWASSENWVEKNGRDFILDMGSDETLINRRDKWHRIPYFTVDVELLTEEP